MGYADRQQRNRELAAKNFVKRYDPAADAMAALEEIDDEVYKRGRDVKADERQSRLDTTSERRLDLQEQRAASADERAKAEFARRSAEDASQAAARDDTAKRAQSEADRKAQEAKRKDAIAAAGAAMASGLSRGDLEQRAAEVGMDPDAFLMAIDEIEQGRQQAEEKRGLENTKQQALIDKANRKPAGPKPKSPEQIAKERDEATIRAQTIEKNKRDLEKKSGGTPLTAGETEAVVELETALSNLDRVARMKTGKDGGAPVDTGPIAALESWFRSKVGMGDPRMVEFKATVGTQLAEYIKSISGATVSEPERAQLLQNVPTEVDDDEEFMAKLQSVERMLRNKLDVKKRAFKAAGKDTRAFEAAPEASTDEAEADALFAD